MELVKIAVNAFVETAALTPYRRLKPRLRFLSHFCNTNHNTEFASIVHNQAFIMTIICALFKSSSEVEKQKNSSC